MPDKISDNLESGSLFGHYQIVEKIGAGGMGEVYLAEDSRLKRKVAFKVLPVSLSADKERLHRFEQEARAASTLNHPNILTVYEFGFERDIHFLATELIEGETLREAMSGGDLTLSEALNIAESTAFALSAAHAAGIVHRDLKPENVMIRRDGIVKVLDFGLAKLIENKAVSAEAEAETRALVKTDPGVVMGTAAYMSPEQARGKDTDARTDVWSLGVLIYEMVGGKTPFAGETANDVIASILKSEPPLLSHLVSNVPDDLEKIVGKCLRKNRDDRYQNIKDLQIDLKDLRRDLEFQAKLERSAAPNINDVKTVDETRATEIRGADKTADAGNAVATNDQISPLHQPSSAEYIAVEIINNKRGIFIAALAVLLAAALGFGGWFYANRSALGDGKSINSIAVLPFENGSGDAGLDYLSDGLSESLIDKLSQLPQLKVIARNSSFKYRGANVDVTEAANKLGVQAIVTGRVVQRGDILTIRIEMVDALENRQLWSEQYNRKVADAFVVQQEVAQTVSEQLRLKLSGAQEQKLAKRELVNPQTYDLFLKGRFANRKGGSDNIKIASEYYQQAIDIDPNYAPAYVSLAGSYLGLIGHSVIDPKEFKPKAKAAVQKALELDPNLPEAHMVMGGVYLSDLNWAAAETELKRAIELNPNSVAARSGYSGYLSIIGRHDEAIAETRRIRELDPLTLGNNVSVGLRLYQARRYDEAIAEFKKILEVDKNYFGAIYWRSYAYLGKGMYREAIDSFQEAIRLGGDNPSNQIYLGASYAKAGEREKAQAILKQLETSKEYVSPGELPVLYVALGEREKAFASFEKAYSAHDLQLQFLKIEPGFDPVRGDPRFQELLKNVGFPE